MFPPYRCRSELRRPTSVFPRSCVRGPLFPRVCPYTYASKTHRVIRIQAETFRRPRERCTRARTKTLLLSLVMRSHALRPRSSIWPVFNYVPGPPLTSNFPNTAIIGVIIIARSTCTLPRPGHHQTRPPSLSSHFLVSFALLLYRRLVPHRLPTLIRRDRVYGLIVATLNYGPCTRAELCRVLNYLSNRLRVTGLR